MLLAVAVGAVFISFKKEVIAPEITAPSAHPLIRITSPLPDETVHSPLVIRGEARGNWFFEATFPIVLTDWDGKIIAEHYAEARDDWMTEEFVPFEATLEFINPSWNEQFSKRGVLIFKKDNPSGLPEYDDAFEVPIRFE